MWVVQEGWIIAKGQEDIFMLQMFIPRGEMLIHKQKLLENCSFEREEKPYYKH